MGRKSVLYKSFLANKKDGLAEESNLIENYIYILLFNLDPYHHKLAKIYISPKCAVSFCSIR